MMVQVKLIYIFSNLKVLNTLTQLIPMK